MHRLCPAVVAFVALGCDVSSSRCEPPEGGPTAVLDDMLELGERDGSAFVPFSEDGEATLVLGAQGGWMVLLAFSLPRPIGRGECYTVEVFAELDSEPLAPVTICGLARHDEGTVAPVRVLLGFDEARLVGRPLSLRAIVSTRTWVAEGEAHDVWLRANGGP